MAYPGITNPGRGAGNGTRQRQNGGPSGRSPMKMKLPQLKQTEARTFNRYQNVKLGGNDKKAALLKDKLNSYRRALTKDLLGVSATKAHLGNKGKMRQSTRVLLRAKLGDNFSNFYYSNPKQTRANFQGTPGLPNKNKRILGPPNRY